MKIKITADSTCDLGMQLLDQHNITTVPLSVIKDGQDFKDGVTITPEDIFAHVAGGGELCSTSAVSIGEYCEVFSRYTREYDAIVHINIGSGFSTCYQSACLAAEEFHNVFVVDSQNLSSGQGLVVLKACELAKNCTDPEDLKQQLLAYTEKIESCFLVDKLDYLVKGGRCSAAAALGANLLNLKPCIEVKNGKMTVVKKYRGSYAKCLASFVKDRLDNREDLDHGNLFLTHTVISEDCKNSFMEAVDTYGSFENIYEPHAGCTVSCHCGPGTQGLMFVRK